MSSLYSKKLDKPSSVQQENNMLIKPRKATNKHTAPYPACWNLVTAGRKKINEKILPHTKA